ncbi:MAG: hypothetical protein CYG60_06745 [Actinobacteria bacterium]|nr:MAG: hypothetical protein CYG60_06745 [Actinomycetota bacterium]
MLARHDPDDFYEAVRLQHEAFEDVARRLRDAGDGEYRPEIWYHTPSGEAIRVAYVARDAGSDVLELQGQDRRGDPCVVIASTASAQIVVKLASISEPELSPGRKPVGFGPRRSGPLTPENPDWRLPMDG